MNYADIAAWELLAQAAGKRALAEYNAFSTFTDDMVKGNFDEEHFKQRKMYVIKDLDHFAWKGSGFPELLLFFWDFYGNVDFGYTNSLCASVQGHCGIQLFCCFQGNR